MTATIQIHQWTGSGAGAGADITGLTSRMHQADTIITNGATTNPIPSIASQTNYSWWVSTRLDCTGAPANSVANLRWFSDGSSAGTGLVVKGAIANVGANAGYRQTTSADGTQALVSTGGTHAHTGLAEATADVSTYTSGSPHSLTGSTTTTGDFGDFFVYQLSCDGTTGPGPMSARTYTWEYDET